MLIGAHPRTTPILSSGHCIATSDGLGDSFDGLMLAKRVFISWISKKRISFFKKEKNPTNTAVKRNFFFKKKDKASVGHSSGWRRQQGEESMLVEQG